MATKLPGVRPFDESDLADQLLNSAPTTVIFEGGSYGTTFSEGKPKGHAMSKSPVFDPKQLRPLRGFCADGTLPFNPKTCERLCREGVLPAIKIGNSWRTTPDAIRAFLWKRGNKTFQKLTV